VVICNLWETWFKGGNNSSKRGIDCHLSAGWKVILSSMFYVVFSHFRLWIVAPELMYCLRYIFLFINRRRRRINCYTVTHIIIFWKGWMLSGEIHCRIEAGLLDVAEGTGLEGQVNTFKSFAVCWECLIYLLLLCCLKIDMDSKAVRCEGVYWIRWFRIGLSSGL